MKEVEFDNRSGVANSAFLLTCLSLNAVFEQCDRPTSTWKSLRTVRIPSKVRLASLPPYIVGIALTTFSPSKCQGCLRQRGEMSWSYVGPRRNVAPGNHFRRASRRVDIRYYIGGGWAKTYLIFGPS